MNSVLLVEDSPTAAMDIKGILEQSGYEVVLAKTFGEMWNKMSLRKYSMILMDYLVDDGTAGEHIRNAKDIAPVIIVSGNASAAVVSQAMREGACGAVDKKWLATLPAQMHLAKRYWHERRAESS